MYEVCLTTTGVPLTMMVLSEQIVLVEHQLSVFGTMGVVVEHLTTGFDGVEKHEAGVTVVSFVVEYCAVGQPRGASAGWSSVRWSVGLQAR